MYKNPPITLPLYTTIQKIKDQVIFDAYKPLLEEIWNTQKGVTKAYKILRNTSYELIEYLGMKITPNMDDAALGELRIDEVEEKRDNS